jgi:c-di-GMP-binding flagellar brake protein YcgR
MEDLEKIFVERRGWPRMIVDELIDEATLLVPTEPAKSAPRAEVVNLSEAGAGLLMPTQLKKGMQVTLEISGKNIPRLNLEAEVRWSSSSPVSTGKYPVGLKFLSLDNQRRLQLQDFVKLMRKFRPPSE